MSISEKLKKEVLVKDIVAIRDSLWSCIALDPTFTKGFQESWKYCLDNNITENDLYEPHDDREMSDEVSNKNFSKLCGELSSNFSKERLDKIKEIGRILYPVVEKKPEKQITTKQNNIYKKAKAPSSRDNRENSRLRRTITGALVGAGGCGLVGGVLKEPLLGVIAGTVLGGAIGAIKPKNNYSSDN